MQPASRPSFTEFILLMGLLSALAALAIDAALPALGVIGSDLHVADPNDNQLIISLLFAGMALGQMLYGPFSDSVGRRRAIFTGMGIFIAGSLVSVFSTDLSTMLAGRFLQGLGAAGPRIVSMALIRDIYSGRAMARVVSFVMSVFILVPVVAPAFGQGVLRFWNWQAIFESFLLVALVATVWFFFRQEETLPPEERAPFSAARIWNGVKETCRNRTAFGYTVVTGLVFAGFVGYLSSAQQIFQDAYKTGEAFPLYFGLSALALGAASFLNGRLVMRLGMRKLSGAALGTATLLSLGFFLVAWFWDGLPPFPAFMAYSLLYFFCMGLLFGNLNAMAMEPLGHIAGVGAAVVGSLSTLIAVPPGMVIGRMYQGDILPLLAGYALLGFCALVLFRWIRREKMEEALPEG